MSAAPDIQAEWWTTSDVAAYLGVAVATVTNYRKRGQMPAPDMTVGRTHMWRLNGSSSGRALAHGPASADGLQAGGNGRTQATAMERSSSR